MASNYAFAFVVFIFYMSTAHSEAQLRPLVPCGQAGVINECVPSHATSCKSGESYVNGKCEAATFFCIPPSVMQDGRCLPPLPPNQRSESDGGSRPTLDLKDCVSVDVVAKSQCNNPSGKVMVLTNRCSKKVDLQACLERTVGRWECGRELNKKYGDEMRYFTCSGTGRYQFYVRDSTSTVPFSRP